MEINTNTYNRIYNHAYWVNAALRDKNFDIDFAKNDYIAFLKEACNNSTIAQIAQREAHKKSLVFNEAVFAVNKTALDNEPEVDVLIKQYKNKVKTLYPKTRKLRKSFINAEQIDVYKTIPKPNKITKCIIKLTSLFTP